MTQQTLSAPYKPCLEGSHFWTEQASSARAALCLRTGAPPDKCEKCYLLVFGCMESHDDMTLSALTFKPNSVITVTFAVTDY